MKKRIIFSLCLSLFLFLTSSCGIPTWFYISSSNARVSNTNTTSNKSTTISISTDHQVEARVMLLYTIHNADGSSTPSQSTIQSNLISDFRSRYRISDANSSRFSATSMQPIASYDHTSSQKTFNLFTFRVLSSDNVSDEGNLPLNGAGSGRDYMFLLDNRGGNINSTIRYSVESSETTNEVHVYATLTNSSSSQDGTRYEIGRFNGQCFRNSSYFSALTDSSNDYQSVETGRYSLYIFPVVYISANDLSSEGHSYSNMMLIYPSNFVSFQL